MRHVDLHAQNNLPAKRPGGQSSLPLLSSIPLCLDISVQCFSQPLSTKPTEPRTKIGTAGRTDKLAGGQFVLKLLGGTSKGPTGTGLRSAFGEQPDSRARSAPSHRVRVLQST